jgi:hypothetical protein
MRGIGYQLYSEGVVEGFNGIVTGPVFHRARNIPIKRLPWFSLYRKHKEA